MATIEFRPHHTTKGKAKKPEPAWLIARGERIDLVFRAREAADAGIDLASQVIAGYNDDLKQWSLLPTGDGYRVHQYGRTGDMLYVRITVPQQFRERFKIKDRMAFTATGVKHGRFVMAGVK